MRRFDYPQSFATGVIAAGGTLGAMFPPSIVLAVYGLITQQDIGKLFIAGMLPGFLAVSMYMATIAIIGRVRPGFLPAAPRSSWAERWGAAREVWAPLALFVFVIGGLYGGLFTPTEAGGMGAGGAFLISVARRRLSRADMLESLLQATRTAAAVFTVLIGAILFGYFLTVTQTPQNVTAFITGLGLGRYGVLVLIMLMYLALGCLMDAMAMIILTVPIIFPVITSLGFDPVWFGVIIVMTVELGLIHPPVGMNVFVIKTVVKDVSFSTIFLGRDPVRADRHHAAGGADRVSGDRAVAAGADVARRLLRDPRHGRAAAHCTGDADVSFRSWRCMIQLPTTNTSTRHDADARCRSVRMRASSACPACWRPRCRTPPRPRCRRRWRR